MFKEEITCVRVLKQKYIRLFSVFYLMSRAILLKLMVF